MISYRDDFPSALRAEIARIKAEQRVKILRWKNENAKVRWPDEAVAFQ